MLSILRIFFRSANTKPLLVLTCLVLAGLAEALGMATLLPTITQITGGIQPNSSPMNAYISDIFTSFNITPVFSHLLLVVICLLVTKTILSMIAMTFVGFQVSEIATSMRASLIDNLMNARWRYFTDQRVGRIANAVSNDATRAGTAYLASARFVSFAIQAMVYVTVAFFLSWKLAATGIAIGLIIVLTLGILIKLSRKAGERQTRRTSDLVTYLSDTLNNIKPLKAMARYDSFSVLFHTKIQGLKRALRGQVLAQQGRFYGEELISFIALGVAFYYAKERWQIPTAELGVMGIMCFQIVAITGKMQRFMQKAVELESAYWSLHNLITESEEQAEHRPGIQAPTLKQGIRFENVSFSYGELPVVEDLNFTVPAGEITVLRGPSGSGKTTILDLAIGFYRPQSGEVLIDDIPLEDISIQQWRKMIGYVPQELTLFHDTIFANVTLGDTNYSEADVETALRLAGAWDFISNQPEKLQTIVGEHGAKISGGQRQRIALARALITKPRLLILDEVTSALDPETELEICDNIRSLGNEYTVLSITHRPVWSEIADNLYEVGNGGVKLMKQSKTETSSKALT